MSWKKVACSAAVVVTFYAFTVKVVHADCDSLITTFNAALTEHSLERVKEVEQKIAIDPDCGGRLIEVQRRRAALQLVLAQQLPDKSNASEALILDADKPDVFWRAAVALGDLRFQQRRFGEATMAYERALEDIKNVSKTPSSPDQKTIKAVFNRATESKLLAANEEAVGGGTFVGAAKDHRDGTIGGTMSPDIRGFKPTAIPIPIGFVTASTKFTPVGEKAAKELLAALQQQAPIEVMLVGHTDERGQADYNMKLSADRAKAVADYLKQNGVAAKVTTIAKGKSEPLQLQDSSGLSREDIWALNRRVVWQRN